MQSDENQTSHLLPFIDMSRRGRSDQTTLRVTSKWPYNVCTIERKWWLWNYESFTKLHIRYTVILGEIDLVQLFKKIKVFM